MVPGIDYVGISTPFYCNDGKGNFLMHKRSELCRDEHGKWDFGGGQLEFGQDIAESVLREVLEEYGCKGEIQEQLPPHSIMREQNRVQTHWVVIPFFIRVNPEDIIHKEPEKKLELGWFRLDKLPSPLHSGVQLTMSKYWDYFDKYK